MWKRESACHATKDGTLGPKSGLLIMATCKVHMYIVGFQATPKGRGRQTAMGEALDASKWRSCLSPTSVRNIGTSRLPTISAGFGLTSNQSSPLPPPPRAHANLQLDRHHDEVEERKRARREEAQLELKRSWERHGHLKRLRALAKAGPEAVRNYAVGAV